MFRVSAKAFIVSVTHVFCWTILSGAAYAEGLYSWTATKGVVNIAGDGNQIAFGDGSGVDVNRAELRSVAVNVGQLNTITAKIKSVAKVAFIPLILLPCQSHYSNGMYFARV